MFHLVSSTSGSVSTFQLLQRRCSQHACHLIFFGQSLPLVIPAYSGFWVQLNLHLGTKATYSISYTLSYTYGGGCCASCRIAHQEQLWGLVTCPRTPQHADHQGNQTSDLSVTRRCHYLWATASLRLCNRTPVFEKPKSGGRYFTEQGYLVSQANT